MKKIIYAFFIFHLTISVSAQKNEKSFVNRDYIFQSNNHSSKKNPVPKDTLSFRLDYTNYCLNKFQKENKIGIGSELLGAVLIAVGNLNSLNGTDKATETYDLEVALSGNSLEKTIKAERKYENKLERIDKTKDVLTISGGVLILAGGILHIISYRWLKRAYVVTIDNGIAAGIKLKF